jgi:endonuclease/exonuclease/phosphatase family metal-dependent hydrolase
MSVTLPGLGFVNCRIGNCPDMDRRAYLLENLRRHRTLEELRNSAFFLECGEEIELFLKTPQYYRFPDASPRLQSFVRAVQWNIEKGKCFDEILRRFRTDPVLKWADIILLNEADYGMNRSQNRHVALELAENLEMNMTFGPAHFELTKGTDDDLALEGENRESVQGNAVLSRYPVLEARVVPLPVCFEPYEFHEKRYGRRNCLWVRLQLKNRALWVASAHLEVRNTPQCRARQIKHILENLRGGSDDAYLIGGDFNTSGFRRGTLLNTAESIARLLFTSHAKMKYRLLHPELGREPLFMLFKHNGFEWNGLNSFEETARTAIGSLEDAAFFPDTMVRWMHKRLEPYIGFLCFKLDWFLGRGIRALGKDEVIDARTGTASQPPACIQGNNAGPERISDHVPIYTDLSLE